MGNRENKILLALSWGFSSMAVIFILLMILEIVSVKMLKVGFITGKGGLFQTAKFIIGFLLLIIICGASIAVIVFLYKYYRNGMKSLKMKFYFATMIEMYLIAFLGIIQRFAVITHNLVSLDWIIILSGLTFGSLSLYAYYK